MSRFSLVVVIMLFGCRAASDAKGPARERFISRNARNTIRQTHNWNVRWAVSDGSLVTEDVTLHGDCSFSSYLLIPRKYGSAPVEYREVKSRARPEACEKIRRMLGNRSLGDLPRTRVSKTRDVPSIRVTLNAGGETYELYY